MVYKLFDKNLLEMVLKMKLNKIINLQMSFMHQLLKKKENRKRNLSSSFKDNICGVDLVDMLLIRKSNKEIRYLLYAVDIFSKYVWVVPLKN